MPCNTFIAPELLITLAWFLTVCLAACLRLGVPALPTVSTHSAQDKNFPGFWVYEFSRFLCFLAVKTAKIYVWILRNYLCFFQKKQWEDYLFFIMASLPYIFSTLVGLPGSILHILLSD